MIPAAFLVLTIIYSSASTHTVHLPMQSLEACEDARGALLATYKKADAKTISMCVTTEAPAKK